METNDDAHDYWAIICPLGGREISTKDFLKKFGVECYVPMGRKKVSHRRSNGRRIRIHEESRVIFSGYAFVKIDAGDKAWGVLDKCSDIISKITVSRGGEMVPYRLDDKEIATIRSHEAAGFYDERAEAKPSFKPGTKVKIASGPMGGFCGIVTRELGSGRLMVDIWGCPVRLPLDFLQPVGL